MSMADVIKSIECGAFREIALRVIIDGISVQKNGTGDI